MPWAWERLGIRRITALRNGNHRRRGLVLRLGRNVPLAAGKDDRRPDGLRLRWRHH